MRIPYKPNFRIYGYPRSSREAPAVLLLVSLILVGFTLSAQGSEPRQVPTGSICGTTSSTSAGMEIVDNAVCSTPRASCVYESPWFAGFALCNDTAYERTDVPRACTCQCAAPAFMDESGTRCLLAPWDGASLKVSAIEGKVRNLHPGLPSDWEKQFNDIELNGVKKGEGISGLGELSVEIKNVYNVGKVLKMALSKEWLKFAGQGQVNRLPGWPTPTYVVDFVGYPGISDYQDSVQVPGRNLLPSDADLERGGITKIPQQGQWLLLYAADIPLRAIESPVQVRIKFAYDDTRDWKPFYNWSDHRTLDVPVPIGAVKARVQFWTEAATGTSDNPLDETSPRTIIALVESFTWEVLHIPSSGEICDAAAQIDRTAASACKWIFHAGIPGVPTLGDFYTQIKNDLESKLNSGVAALNPEIVKAANGELFATRKGKPFYYMKTGTRAFDLVAKQAYRRKHRASKCTAKYQENTNKYLGCMDKADAKQSSGRGRKNANQKRKDLCKITFKARSKLAIARFGKGSCPSLSIDALAEAAEAADAQVDNYLLGSPLSPEFFVQSAESAEFAGGILRLEGAEPQTFHFAMGTSPLGELEENDLFLLRFHDEVGPLGQLPPTASLACDYEGEPAHFVLRLKNPVMEAADLLYEVDLLLMESQSTLPEGDFHCENAQLFIDPR